VIVRSAFLEGSVAESDRAAFDLHMRDIVLPAIRAYPKLLDVRLRSLSRGEEGAPDVYMVFDLYFKTLQDMDDALKSSTRQAVRSVIAQGMSMFKGRVFHLVFEEASQGDASMPQ
jgi:hypothetical protein